ncbi:sugar porter family MFS transporter [Coraliomargarita akajimensis]|uniref:Sugar transporter n=1 Tax=Coraliomargarita akajimensis (strain DSM 45221 / IAM 15411 / JCM 23193 / KCTC 12865 / 04OKA010-24) TaxID=583355 RepID=D5EQM2_CORAD|nr:sugar porter family MFS transporter [Coraliomargarita akajimensis]ADE55836.1 sugar transporter [Coraliomargarita akajimensis DSM 45221]
MSEETHLGKTLIISIVATIGGFLFGFDSGVINGTVEGLRTAFNASGMGTGFNVASMLLGCAAGAFFAGNLADYFGRRTILLVAAVLFTISAWGSGISTASGEFIVYRIIGGIAVGAASVLAPAYISEIAPAHLRGRLSSIQQVAIICGLTIAFLSNYVIANMADGSALNELAWGYEAWRWMYWVELVPSVTFFFALLCIPESPRFLVASGKREKAIKVLTGLMGDRAEAKYEQIKGTLQSDHRPSMKDIVGPALGLRPLVWVGIGLAMFQQLVGINVVFYYGAVLWQSVGFGESDALMINVISGTLSIGSCIVALFVIDKIGRKPMLTIGSIGMTITLLVVAFIFATAGSDESGGLKLTGAAGPIALVSANLYVMFFNFSWGPVMWVMLGEMFPNQMRGAALATSGLAQWLANFAITMTFPILLAGVGLGAAYGMYAFFAAISIPFILKFVRETKGKQLEEMEG